MSIEDFLDQKPLYYKEIDHERVHQAYALLKPHIRQPRTIHIVGTNGKGSTGRILAHLAREQGIGSQEQLSVGHYSSPHILKFNERIWLDGQDVSDDVLETAHQRLYSILGEAISNTLTYFEYTTLLAFVVFEACDLMVLEAGLGGEYDATNVCDKELSIITPIGLDHQSFLGESIEEIAATKINSIQKKDLLAPQPFDKVVGVAKKIAEEKGAELIMSEQGAESREQLREIARQKGWADYLVENAMVALQALDILDISYRIDDLKTLELFGRFYPLKENIRIDVGHNPLAAEAIVKAMKPETILIYNSLDDKDYRSVLQTLKPKVKRVEIIQIDSQRATTTESIVNALEIVGLPYIDFDGTIHAEEHYLVFGSFYVVEAFLKTIEN